MPQLVVPMAALAAIALAPTTAHGRKPLIVELPDGSGAVEGLDLRDGATGSFEVNAFLGIPFAQPPTKTRRWTSPEKHLPWKGVRPAKQFAPNCMQLDPPAWSTMKKNVSEDCLYLNVWSPAQEEGAQQGLTYPVMVFIHGGGYVSAAMIALLKRAPADTLPIAGVWRCVRHRTRRKLAMRSRRRSRGDHSVPSRHIWMAGLRPTALSFRR